MINSISDKYFSVKVKLFQYFLIQTCAHANGLTVREKTVDTITEQNYSYLIPTRDSGLGRLFLYWDA